MRKKVMAVVFAVLAFSLIAASAATLGVTVSSGVGQGEDDVAACDPNGVNVSDFTLNSTPVVTAVTVSGIHGNCVDEDIYVTVLDGGAPLGTVGAVVTGDPAVNNNQVTISGFSADPLALDGVRVVIG